ncbi:hypothetical protein Tco_1063810 [Tanacetum coccineum]
MNQTPLQELRETSNSTDLPKMWTVRTDRELVRDNDIVRRLVEIYIWVCLVVDDNIFNLVDLHMGMFGSGWKWQDL